VFTATGGPRARSQTRICERVEPRRRINGISLSKPCFKIESKGKRFEEVCIEGNLRQSTGRISA
jgi:hypothetical protein